MTEKGTDEVHAELDAAAEDQSTPAEETPESTDTQETPQEETTPQETPEEVPEEPTDNRERSNLGRKVKSLEETMQKFIEQTGALIQTSIKPVKEEPPEPEYEADFVPTNVSELDRWYETKKRKEEKQKEAYQSSYRATLDVLGQDTPLEEHQAVVTEMMKNFNIKRSGDGMNDATVNYLNAKVQYLKRANAAPKNPLQKNEGKENKNLGTPAGSPSMKIKAPQAVKLDHYAAEFVAKTKMSDESVQAALTGEMPSHLAGRR